MRNWRYYLRNVTDNPIEVLSVLKNSGLEEYLSGSTLGIDVDCHPINDLINKPHYHLKPQDGELYLTPFSSIKNPELLKADKRSVTIGLANIVITLYFTPDK